MMAGGASLAPRRWSLPASAMLARRRSAWTLTARMTATRKARNCALACGSCAGVEQVLAVVGGHRPVVVLARAVDAGEGLLVEQEHQAVLRREPPHRAHDDHVVVGRRRRSARRRAPSRTGPGATSLWRVLAGMPSRQSSRSRSIMKARMRSRIAPKYWSSSSWPLGDGAPKRVRPGEDEVGALLGQAPVDQEVLLLGADGGEDPARGRVAEPAQDAQGLLAEGLLRAQQRDLLVQRLARVRDEGRRDGQGDAVRLDLQEDRAGDVPGGVAAGLEGGADAARGEGADASGSPWIRLLARELGDRPAVRRWGSGTSRASRPWSRSWARTSACSGWRRGPWPTPSRRGRPRRR